MSASNGNHPKTDSVIAGFWRRILAYGIDTILLATVCGVIGFLFYDQVASLGSYGRLIGWVLALAYFTPLNSAFGKGQTVGKRIQQIRVVDGEGQFIGIGHSFIRAFVLTAPFLLNGIFVPTDNLPQPLLYAWSSLFSLIIFGGIIAIIYLYIFNRRTRQSLHDLVVGTFVINVAAQPITIKAQTARIHIIVAGALGVLAAVVPLVFLNSEQANAFHSSALMAVYTSVKSMPEISSATVTNQNFSKKMLTGDNAGIQQSHEFILVSVKLKKKLDDFNREADRIAEKVLQYPDALNGKPLTIAIATGIDLGFASWHVNYLGTHTAAEWKKGLAKTK